MVSIRHILFLLVQKRKTILIHTVHIYPQEQINFQFYFHLKQRTVEVFNDFDKELEANIKEEITVQNECNQVLPMPQSTGNIGTGISMPVSVHKDSNKTERFGQGHFSPIKEALTSIL